MTGVEGIRLRLLGVPAVEGPGEDAAGVLSQPKRLALLAYLAVQGGFVRREVLVEMFWPDSDPERARRALSQATHTLRRSLGRSAIRSRGNEELGISTDHVWIDVRAFEAAVAGERWEEAVSLHRAELLHGLNGDQLTPEFSRWLDGERLRLQRSAAGAAKRLADGSFREGDIAGAIAWARKAVAVRPLDESVFREYLALLDEAGDAALALSEYESFRSRLGTEYDLDPSRETVRLIEMIRSRRPETVAAVPQAGQESRSVVAEAAGEAGSETQGGGSRPQSATRAGGRRWRPRSLKAAFAMLPLILAGWLISDFIFDTPRGAANPVIVANRIAVLHLEPVGPNAEKITHVARNLTKSIITYLHSYSSLSVVPLDAVNAFRGRSIGYDSLSTVLRAAMYMSGEVDLDADGMTRVTIELLDDEQQLRWRTDLRFETTDLIAIEDSVVSAITAHASVLGAVIERNELLRGTTDEDAYANVAKAINLVEQFTTEVNAGRIGPAGSLLSNADSLLDLANDRDPSWSRPFTERARVKSKVGFYCYLTDSCDWEGAFLEGVNHASHVIRGNARHSGSHAEALEVRADLYWQLWMHGTGRDSDTTYLSLAESDIHGAIATGAHSSRAYSLLGEIYSERGQYQQGLDAGLEALRRDEFLTREAIIVENVFNAAFNAHDDTLSHQLCVRMTRIRPWSFRTLSCRLQLAAWTPVAEPDVGQAWSVLNEFRERSAAQYGMVSLQSEFLVAAVIAAASAQRPELADSARRVVERLLPSRAADDDDPLVYAAAVYAMLGEAARANELLTEYLANGIRARLHARSLRWFEGVVITDLNDIRASIGHGR